MSMYDFVFSAKWVFAVRVSASFGWSRVRTLFVNDIEQFLVRFV